jgi:hypothetical protein
MDNQIDRELLQQLHDEINKTQTVDEKGKELLRDLDGDIRELLARSEEHPGQPQSSIVDNLESTVSHFEVTHPELTVLVSKLLATLSNAGI